MFAYADRCCSLARITIEDGCSIKALRREIRLIKVGKSDARRIPTESKKNRKNNSHRSLMIMARSDEKHLIENLKKLKFIHVYNIPKRHLYDNENYENIQIWILTW